MDSVAVTAEGASYPTTSSTTAPPVDEPGQVESGQATSGRRWCRRHAEVQGDVTNGVAAEGLGWIKPARRSPERDAVGHVAGPAAFPVLTMVKTAHQSEIFEVGAAAVRAWDHMMTFARCRRGPLSDLGDITEGLEAQLDRAARPQGPCRHSVCKTRTTLGGEPDEKWAEIRSVRRRDHGARVVNASGLVALSTPPPMHATGWSAVDWFGNLFFALLGWISVAGAVCWMYRNERNWVNQSNQSPPPTALARAWEYIIALCIGLGGAILGTSFGWLVERHLASVYLIFVWLALPLICRGAVLLFWDRWAKPGLATAMPAGQRSTTESAVWMAVLAYLAVFIIIAGADAITRLAAEVALPTDTVIVLVLIGILGWVLWIYRPRRRRRRRAENR